jgi:uncharacterized membrane protein YesL
MNIMNSTKDYIRTVLDTIRYDFGDLMVSNVLWLLVSLPIITIPPAFAGLYYSTSKLAHNESGSRQTFFAGFKKYFRTSYYWFISNVIVVGLLLFNIDLSIQNSQLLWLQFFSGVSWVILAAWMLLQIYTFPLLIQQDDPRLVLALRNSAVLLFKHSIFSLLLSVVIILLVVVSIFLFPFWFVITASLIAYLTNLGVIYLLSKE